MRVTVLMSVHNGGRWLRPAIDSILAQTWQDFEFLILDDASTDDTVAQVQALSDPRIRLIRLDENIGLTRSLNVGLREAQGEFIARQDADDLSSPDRLARQIDFLDAHPEIPLIGSRIRLIDPEGRSRGVRDLPLESVSIRWLSLLDNPIAHTTTMFRTAVIRDEFGGYDETFSCCQDYDLWTRVMEKFPVANLPQRLADVREHGASISATRGDEARKLVQRVVARLAGSWLPGTSAETIDLLCSFRRHLTPAEVKPFHEALEQVDRKFTDPSSDLARTRAAVFARIGYNLLTQDRGLAMQEFVRAIKAHPAITTEIPWARALALFILGPKARTAFERFRG